MIKINPITTSILKNIKSNIKDEYLNWEVILTNKIPIAKIPINLNIYFQFFIFLMPYNDPAKIRLDFKELGFLFGFWAKSNHFIFNFFYLNIKFLLLAVFIQSSSLSTTHFLQMTFSFCWQTFAFFYSSRLSIKPRVRKLEKSYKTISFWINSVKI